MTMSMKRLGAKQMKKCGMIMKVECHLQNHEEVIHIMMTQNLMTIHVQIVQLMKIGQDGLLICLQMSQTILHE